jgi:hypothetical protein
MTPAGYVLMQHGMRDSRPVKAYQRWMDRIPPVYRSAVLGEPEPTDAIKVSDDPHCLAQLKHYRSLMPLSMEAHKPIFHLKPADGAIGSHFTAVNECKIDFIRLARRLGETASIDLKSIPHTISVP